MTEVLLGSFPNLHMMPFDAEAFITNDARLVAVRDIKVTVPRRRK